MLYELKEYQLKANLQLDHLIEDYLSHPEIYDNIRKNITFKAPTGSGKTLMVSSVIEDLCENLKKLNFCFIWACPGKGDLHLQSYNAVNKYLCGNPVCTLLESDFFGSRSYIKNKEVVFVNWEKLINKDKSTGEWKNNLMKDQEGKNLIDVLDETKRNGTKIILIIDESHIGASSDANTRINEFQDRIICPNITLKMSATPKGNPDVEVDAQSVIDAGMIKKDIIVNEGISKEDRCLEDKDSEQIILEKAFEKREELAKKYKEIKSNVNPLVLLQIPNTEAGEAKKDVIKEFLASKGVTENNGKLAIWLTDSENFDKNLIRDNDNKCEFLIFKTAVATGWDCPRAQILVTFRETKSETFKIQTIGRILRTPEAKSYDDELLDNAYIFTNLKEIATGADSYNPNRIKTLFSKINSKMDCVKANEETVLKSFYRSRKEDYNSADSRFNKYFCDAFMKYFDLEEKDKDALVGSLAQKFTQKGMNLDVKSSDELMEETKVSTKNADKEQKITSDLATVSKSDSDIEAEYFALISQNLNGLAYKRSRSFVSSSIKDAFSTFYNVFPSKEKVKMIQKLVVNNKVIFEQILSEATKKFKDFLESSKGRKGKKYDFTFMYQRTYSVENYMELEIKKSLYTPLYVLKNERGEVKNKLEKDFLTYLDSKEEVNWIFENGSEPNLINFGIPYDNDEKTFQPDFIVKFNNGNVGILDTKSIDDRQADVKIKAEALAQYILDINRNRGHLPMVFGGIVIKDGTQFFLNNKSEYVSYRDGPNEWENMNDRLFKINADIKAKKSSEDFVKKMN